MRKHIFLTGMMGSGKSTLGRELAESLGVAFVDIDELIVTNEGISIPEIFEQRGEEGFRRAETNALRHVCRSKTCVAATGGGIVLRDENVSLMRSAGIIVLLDRPLEEMIRDVRQDGRPNLAGDKEERMRALYAERKERYHACSDLAFNNTGGAFMAVKRLLKEPTVIMAIK